MFLSKAPSVLRNTFNKLQSNVSWSALVQNRLTSTTTSGTSPGTSPEAVPSSVDENVSLNTVTDHSQELPDKLYKKIEVEVRGNDAAVLKSYGVFAETAANELGIEVTQNMAPHKAEHVRWSVLKSVHIYKKHQVQYEYRTYYRFLHFTHLTGSTADTFLEYIQRNLPEGVAMKVTKYELQYLPTQILNP